MTKDMLSNLAAQKGIRLEAETLIEPVTEFYPHEH